MTTDGLTSESDADGTTLTLDGQKMRFDQPGADNAIEINSGQIKIGGIVLTPVARAAAIERFRLWSETPRAAFLQAESSADADYRLGYAHARIRLEYARGRKEYARGLDQRTRDCEKYARGREEHARHCPGSASFVGNAWHFVTEARASAAEAHREADALLTHWSFIVKRITAAATADVMPYEQDSCTNPDD